MAILCDNKICTGCAACAAVCPTSCISMIPDEEGFLRPVIDSVHCTECHICTQVCPPLSYCGINSQNTTALAAINMDYSVREHSTSGGVFSLLCEYILNQGGVVFGAAYNSDFSVSHCCIEDMDDLHSLRQAKYVQSNITDCYHRIKTILQRGRPVLFSGTPCQVHGVQSYLGKDYNNLLLVDLICHGIPSPKVWQHYIHYRCNTDANGARPTSINMRSKESGWASYSVHFDYTDGGSYIASNRKDPYIKGFIGNLYLRPSCYDCSFKGVERISDITLGDYWGVWSQHPEIDDQNGVSLVLLHSIKGKKIFDSLSEFLKAIPLDLHTCLDENPSAVQSPSLPKGRNHFMLHYESDDFSSLVNSLLSISAEDSQQVAPAGFLSKLKYVIDRLINS